MLKRLSKDQRGIAAVEFALTLPVMILLYCGLAEISMAMVAEREAAHAASVVGDLVAQNTQIDAATMTDIFAIGSQIVQPFPTGPLQLRITSIKADAAGVPKVVWSKGHGLGALTAGATAAAVPAGLLAVGDSVIEADMAYSYTSPIRQVLPTPLSYSDTFFLKPRKASEVLWVGP